VCPSNRAAFECLTSYHPTSDDAEVANLLKAAEGIDLCLSFADWDALVPIVVQNDRLAGFLPKVE
jgi:hypothetical protein